MHQDLSKICKFCETVKPLDDFYRHPEGRLGRMHVCKECHKAAVRKNRAENIEEKREYDRSRAWDPARVAARKAYAEEMKKDPKFQAKMRERREFWLNKNMVKRRAHVMAGNAIRDGKLVPAEACERCGNAGPVQGHHENYYKPLELTWLCSGCHGLRHREINAEIRAGVNYSIKGFTK